VRNDPISVRTDALARAALEHDVERRADTVGAVERRLGVSFIPGDELVWLIGTGSPSLDFEDGAAWAVLMGVAPEQGGADDAPGGQAEGRDVDAHELGEK